MAKKIRYSPREDKLIKMHREKSDREIAEIIKKNLGITRTKGGIGYHRRSVLGIKKERMNYSDEEKNLIIAHSTKPTKEICRIIKQELVFLSPIY